MKSCFAISIPRALRLTLVHLRRGALGGENYREELLYDVLRVKDKMYDLCTLLHILSLRDSDFFGVLKSVVVLRTLTILPAYMYLAFFFC